MKITVSLLFIFLGSIFVLNAQDYLAQAREYKEKGAFTEALQYAYLADSVYQQKYTVPSIELAEVSYLIGVLSYNLSYLPEASQQLKKAERQFRALKKHGRTSDTKVHLGNTFWYTLGADTALHYFNDAIDLAEKDSLDEQELLGHAYYFKGYAFLELARFEEAKKWIDKGLDINYKKVGFYHRQMADAYNVLSVFYKYTEQHKKALSVSEQVLSIYDSIFPSKEELEWGVIYGEIGLNYFQLHQLPKALDYYDKTEEVFISKKLPPNSYNMLLLKLSKAEVFFNLNQRSKAKRLYEELLELSPAEYYDLKIAGRLGIIHCLKGEGEIQKAYQSLKELVPYVDSTMGKGVNLALCYEQLNQNAIELGRLKEALGYITEAENIYRTINSPTHPSMVRVYSWKAKIALEKEDLENAVFYSDKGLGLFSKSEEEVEFNNIPDYWFLLMLTKAQALKKQGRVDAAISVYLKIDEHYEYLRRTYLSDEGKAFVADFHDETYKSVAHLMAQQKEKWAYAFLMSEKNKGYLLLEKLKKESIPFVENLEDQTSVYKKQIISIRQKIYDEQQSQKASAYKLEQWQGEMADVKLELSQLLETARRQNPKLFSTITKNSYSTPKDVQLMLAPDEAFIEYMIVEDSLLIFYITNQHFELLTVPAGQNLAYWTKQLRNELSTPNPMRIGFLSEAITQVYQIAFKPVTSFKLPPNLIIITDGVLSEIPFEVLAPTFDKKNIQNTPFLISQYNISYAYSASLLQNAKESVIKSSSKIKVLAMAPFDAENINREGKEFASKSGLSILSYSREEIQGITKYFQTDTLFGVDATRAAFFDKAPHYDIIHLNTHGRGYYNLDSLSHLYLASPNAAEGYDKLFLRELYLLPLKARLAVLSACETGIGYQQSGEGVISLARAFAYAGVQSIATTLWRVNDASTQKIWSDFYRNLLSGQRKSEALNAAQRSYIAKHPKGLQSHPYYWCGIVLIGDVSPVVDKKKY